MRSSKPPRGCVRVRGAIVFASLLCSTCPPLIAQDPSPVPAQPGSREAWHESMVRTPLPGKGCFKASYPSTDWQEVPCTTPPSYPLGRTGVGGNNSDTVGNTSGDFAAQVPGLIVTAEGSFISVTPGISEEGNTYYTPPNTPPNNCSVPTKTNVANTFTLQLNTNIFPISLTSVCIDPVYVKCGWQQFVFDNYAAVAKNGQQLAQAYMQYWLIGYGAACLPGWSQSSSGCYRNSPSSAPIPAQTMADLSGITIMATADSGGTDTLIVQTAGGDLTALGSDSLLHLAQRWDAAEFNIFGDGCASQANFSSGSTIVVKTSVVDSSLDTPTWVQESFTGETDNLNLVPTPCVYGKPSPAIEFMETNAANPVATCFSSGLQAFTTLASFNGGDGSGPFGELIQATNGDLYGTTNTGGAYGGGAYGGGTVFKIIPSGTLTTLYSFCSQSGCPDGEYPDGRLVQATNGDLYGTTNTGANGSGGTVRHADDAIQLLLPKRVHGRRKPLGGAGPGHQRRPLRDNRVWRGVQRWHGLQPICRLGAVCGNTAYFR